MNKCFFYFFFFIVLWVGSLLVCNAVAIFNNGNTPLPFWLEQKKAGDYTYQQELKADRVEQLVNQVIVPQTVVRNGKTTTVVAGDVRILIGSDIINFKGVNALGAFSIVGKEKLAGKWVFRLNDIYKEEVQELSLLLDAENFVQSVQLTSRNYGEIVFKLPVKSAVRLQAERQYYTAKSAVLVRTYPDLVGKKLVPQRKLQKINSDLRDDKIDIAEQLFFSFDSENITLNIGRQSTVLKVKNANITPISGRGKAIKILTLTTTKDPASINILLNAQNQIEAIEWGDTEYRLAP